MTDTVRIGTPLKGNAFRVLFCGSGVLGKEVVIELQRFGVEVIAVDRIHSTRSSYGKSNYITLVSSVSVRWGCPSSGISVTEVPAITCSAN